MRKLKLILISLLITSCSKEDLSDECNCIKETYKYNQTVVTGSNGLPRLQYTRVMLSTESVSCQDEQDQVEQGNGILFDIICE